MSRVSPRAIVFAAVAVAVLGCGDSERATTNSGTASSDAPARQATDKASSPAVGGVDEDVHTPSETTSGPQAITKDSGAVYVPPEKPTAQTTTPGRGCRDQEERSGGRTLRVSFPPAPGVRVTRMGSGVRVDYRFDPVPSRCRPVALEVTLDVNDDPLPGRSANVEISALRGSVRVDIPPDMQDSDVARVIARTERGAPSESVAVPIR